MLEGTSAARIFTGAPIPKGADSVVMQEDVVRDGGRYSPLPPSRGGSEHPCSGAAIWPRARTVLDMGRKLGPEGDRCLRGRGLEQGILRRSAADCAWPCLVTGDEVRRAGGAREGRTDLGREHTDAHGKPCTCRH